MNKIQINFRGEDNFSEPIRMLAEILSEADFSVDEINKGAEKATRGDIITGIAIASLAVSAINTFISVLSYWHESHPKFTLTVESNGVKVTAENLSTEEEAKEAIKSLLASTSNQSVEIFLDTDSKE